KRSGIKTMLTGMRVHPSKVLREFYRLSFGAAKQMMDSDSPIPNPSTMIDGLKYLLDCDISDEVGAIKVPTLIIAGEDDVIVKPSLSRSLSEMISGSVFVVIPKVGHSLPFSKTDEIRKTINEFMREKNIF
ncbi:MAG TPA: alpha/beta hydrolase, partial [Victivallales bacterium]|nr:alpha/beta hydrolase [Victivallales bacterium]